MSEFLAILTTFVFGLGITVALGAGLESRAKTYVDEGADVRPGIISLTASGYAIAPVTAPVQLGFRDI